MTNRDLLIKQLKERDDKVICNLMCPMIPGDGEAFCSNTAEADYQTECKPCMRAWLDREADDEET